MSRDEVRDVAGHRVMRLGAPFRVLFADGLIVRAEQMRVVERPMVEDLKVDVGASRAAERIGGKGVRAVLEDDKSGLRVEWRLELRDGSEYVRQSVTLSAPQRDLAMRLVRLVDVRLDRKSTRLNSSHRR